MNDTFFSITAAVLNSIGAAFIVMAMPVLAFFGYVPPQPIAREGNIQFTTVSTTSVTVAAPPATSSPPVAVVVPVPKKVVPVPVVIPKPVVVKPVVVVPIQPPPPATTTVSFAIGTTTLAVQSIPLLFGGTAHTGESVPVSYLQITNVGTAGAQVKGFWIKQNGSAPPQAIIGLSTVDDVGGSRGLAGGLEGTVLFQNGRAFAPTDAYFAPGQMRLFTVKAMLTQNVLPYSGTQLMIDVASIETTGMVSGQFPIRGTTWTIAQ